MSRSYWPTEGRPEFVAEDPDGPWVPLCSCGEPLRMPEGNVQVWECSLAPVSHQKVMLWAEDWPDYDEENICPHCGGRLDQMTTVDDCPDYFHHHTE